MTTKKPKAKKRRYSGQPHGTLGATITALVKDNPKITISEIMAATNCSNSHARRILAAARKSPAQPAASTTPPKPIVRQLAAPATPAPLQMSMQLPPGGVEIKVLDGATVGTLTITRAGINFIPPNGKLRPKKPLNWQSICLLQQGSFEV